jgi:hypothetical protein
MPGNEASITQPLESGKTYFGGDTMTSQQAGHNFLLERLAEAVTPIGKPVLVHPVLRHPVSSGEKHVWPTPGHTWHHGRLRCRDRTLDDPITLQEVKDLHRRPLPADDR